MALNKFSLVALALVLPLTMLSTAHAATMVPTGNRNVQQPAIPYGSIKRTRSGKGTFDKKYIKIRNMLGSNKKLIRKIKKAANAYNIDPIHIIGALVGEHTYNVDALDRYQTYYVKALAYLNQDLSFQYKGKQVTDFVKQREFSSCFDIKASYDRWSCREYIWNSKFRGKRVVAQPIPMTNLGGFSSSRFMRVKHSGLDS